MRLFRPIAAILFAALVALPISGIMPARATIGTSANKTIALGNGSTTVFDFNFIGVSAAYISVIYTDANGNQTTLTQGSGTTQYQISLNSAPPGAIWGVGGTVTYAPNGTPIASGTSLTIYRTLPLTQAISLQNKNSLTALGNGAETGLDTGVMQSQQISENIARAIVAPIVDATPPAPLPPIAQRANQGAAFDGDGNLVAAALPSSGIISSAMQPVVDAASLALGRTAFGLGSTATENIGAGLQDDGSGNLRVNSTLVSVATNQTVTASFHRQSYIATGPITFTLPQASTLWNGFTFTVYAFTGPITITPNASDNFPSLAGGASYTVPQGTLATITTNGTNPGTWYAGLVPQAITPPQGYLTPCSATVSVTGCTTGNLVPSSDVTSVSTLYYQSAPNGNMIPLYNGATMMMLPFSELALTLSSNNLANTLYDVCIFNNGGTPTIVTAPAWQTSTAGSGARGTSAAIVRTQGYWTNNVAITGSNGASTYSIPANACTIVATIFIDGTAGQVTFNRTYGQSRKWAAWNFYNRQVIYLKAGQTGTWTYSSNGWRPANNQTANSLSLLTGLQEEPFNLGCSTDFGGTISPSSSGSIQGGCAVGYNSTSVPSGRQGLYSFNAAAGTVGINIQTSVNGAYQAPPDIGVQVITELENGFGSSATITFNGSEQNTVLSAWWRG